jgi:hypothetical protein
MGALLGLLGLAALGVSLVGLVRGHVGWARLPSRKAAAAAAAGSLVVLVVAGALTPSPSPSTTSSSSLARSPSATATPTSASPSPTPTSTPTPTPRITHAPDGSAMPDRTLTPGNALVSAAAVVCAPEYATSISDVSEDLRRGVLAAYAIEDAQRDGYELDHLIPVELGGDNSAGNLWPQPRTGIGNAAVKNGLESHLRDLVCAGAVPLAEAQHTMASDWSAANARYAAIPVPPPPAAVTSPPPPPAPPAPSASSAPALPVKPPAQPAPQRSTAPATGGNVVHPGAFCKPAGATGVTVDGTPMVCGPASDGRNRWHSR